MRGAVAAGMCLVLEAAGLMASFDRVYGCSSGALTGCFAAAGQASRVGHELRGLRRAATFIDPARAFRGGPVLDLDFLFDDVIARRRPLSEAGLAAGPEFRAVAVSATHAELRVLGDFESAADLLGRRAGELLDPGADRRAADVPGRADGGRRPARVDPVPHGAARGRDARARPALARRELPRAAGRTGFAEPVLARAHPELAPLLRSCSQRYNRDAPARAPGRQPPGARSCGRSPCRTGSRLVPRLQHRPRPHRRQRPAGRAHDGVRALRRARHAVLAALPRAARGLACLDSGCPGAPTGDAAVDDVDHLARAVALRAGSRRPRARWPEAQIDGDRPLPGRCRRAARRCRGRA